MRQPCLSDITYHIGSNKDAQDLFSHGIERDREGGGVVRLVAAEIYMKHAFNTPVKNRNMLTNQHNFNMTLERVKETVNI